MLMDEILCVLLHSLTIFPASYFGDSTAPSSYSRFADLSRAHCIFLLKVRRFYESSTAWIKIVIVPTFGKEIMRITGSSIPKNELMSVCAHMHVCVCGDEHLS